jgi:Fe-S cluster assembly iron-binding protein IscA
MISITRQAIKAIHTLCAEAEQPPSVRIRAVGSGRPLPVQIITDPEPRAGDDLVAAADGVVVLLDRELASAVADHTLEAWSDEHDSRWFFLTNPENNRRNQQPEVQR